MPNLIINARFYFLRLAHFHLWTLISLLLAVALLLASAGAWLVSRQYNEEAQDQLMESERRARNASVTRSAVAKSKDEVRLLPKLDAADFTIQFQRAAQDVGLVIEEVTYTLDDSTTQPYLRYRMNLTAQSDYPKIRRLIAATVAEFPNVSMDSIACAREKVGVPTVGCKLSFSAFFSKA